ncbi:MAG: hypothetical protein E3J56_05175 [Candidatus Aminicenantes bacterium]|nr:MAG: hypothetical protein E3J56_05175 [Candidatus Aminicenantes bacterium]
MASRVIALMTDFGKEDFFVASLKGTILKINPLARIVDITHRVPSFDVFASSFVLFSTFQYFPLQTIFLVIVDPGVGSSRKILLAETKNYFFIAPDNGVLSLVIEKDEIKQIRKVTNEKFFLPNPSSTFEGRDKMAPVAAWLSKEVPCEEFGHEVSHYKKVSEKRPQVRGNEILGRILYVDKFGNLITNVPFQMVDFLREKRNVEMISLFVKNTEILSFKKNYSSAKKGELLFLGGSLGLIEIAVREGSACEKLKAETGDEVRIITRCET